MDVKDRKYYRILERLSYGGGIVERGAFHSLERCKPSALDALQKGGSISRVSAPPLAQLPGWTRRAKKLSDLGVETVTQLLATERDAIAEAMEVKPDTVRRWQDEALGWMTIAPKRG